MKKKIVAAILCLSVAVALSACQKADTATETTETEQVEQKQDEEPSEEADKETEEAQPAKEEEKEETFYGNMVTNGDFSTDVLKWGTYFNGGIAAISINPEKQLAVNVVDCGSLMHSVQTYYDGFKLDTGVVYKFAFDIACDTERSCEWRIQINGGDYHAYFSEIIKLTPEMTHYEYELTMEEGSDPAPRMCFNLGKIDGDPDLEQHVVTIDNVELSILDDSNKVVADAEIEKPDINVNQVGYQPDDIKIATFRGDSIGKDFAVVDAKSGEEVFTGSLSDVSKNVSSQENTAVGDFSAFNKPGTYKLQSEGLTDSYEFTIADTVYDDLLKDTVRMLYLQRCGMELTGDLAGDFSHPVCHDTEAVIYDTDKKVDVSGGWHDAGDYGRYVVPGAKAAADLMLAYEKNPSAFTDDYNIPESGNGVADILDEARYELDWMLKMQDSSSGGVYHKVTCANFPSTVLPQDETEQLIVSPISPAATGDFAAVMAMAARVYKDVDADFAAKALDASKKALDYIKEHVDDDGFKNPEDIVTGEYDDAKATDELYWALAELYKTTQDKAYEDQLSTMSPMGIQGDLGWQKVGYYGMYAYLTSEDTDPEIVEAIKNKIDFTLEKYMTAEAADAYGSTIEDAYPWGSNMTVANHGMLLLMASETIAADDSTLSKQYTDAAYRQLDYLLGTNANSYCFVTGYGSLCPEHPHHRPSQVLGKAMKGMLIGGPDSGLDDPYAKATLSDKAKSMCYADNEQSYSCNEITIYWNSPLIYLISGLKK